jgi:hypothetical protein
MFISFAFVMTLPLFAQTPEITTRDDARVIVSTVKDLEVKDMLKATAEFKQCQDKYKIEAGKTTKTGSLDDAVKCFKDQLKGKDEKKLQELSDALNLQSYGLVKSKNSKDIQEYLNDKMYEALTGINPKVAEEKKWIDEMKFSKKKHIDQSLFIKMYKTQLSKNALFEISRYCFQNLRRKDRKENNFSDHWAGFTMDNRGILQDVNDSGEPKFAKDIDNPQEKGKVYEQLLQSINGNTGSQVMTSKKYTDFFEACGKTMVHLCDIFKEANEDNIHKNRPQQDQATTSTGAASCISKNRIQELKTALENAGKVEKQFAEMKVDSKSLTLALSGEPVKMFEAGKNGNASLDELTSYSSKDMLEGGVKTSSNTQIDECEKNPQNPACASLLGNEESFSKAKHDLELEMTLKREAEMVRVKKIVEKDRTALKEYLEKNGFYSILKIPDFEKMTPDKIAAEVGKEFEAKKIAMLSEMNSKLGRRQVKKDATDQDKKITVEAAVKESKEERARLAQVVMFNNIITSHLTLRRKTGEDQYEDVGRNLNPWKKEEKDLIAAKVEPRLFENLKAKDEGKKPGSGIQGDEQLAGIEFIDSMLGKTKKQEGN